MEEMKIFEFKYRGEPTDWVYATTKSEAIKILANEYCENIDNIKDSDFKEIPKESWGDCYLTDINEQEPDPDETEYNEDDYFLGYKIIETLSEYAMREKTPGIIASFED